MRQINSARSDKLHDGSSIFVKEGLTAAGAEGGVKVSSWLFSDEFISAALVDFDVIDDLFDFQKPAAWL